MRVEAHLDESCDLIRRVRVRRRAVTAQVSGEAIRGNKVVQAIVLLALILLALTLALVVEVDVVVEHVVVIVAVAHVHSRAGDAGKRDGSR